jgi:transcriptional regulator with GAF, ATPase, and Fis domain
MAFYLNRPRDTNDAEWFIVSWEDLQMTVRLRTADRYATILEVNRAAITQPGLNEMFRGMCTAVKRVIPYDRAGLSLYAPEKGALELAARDGCFPDSFYNIGVTMECKDSHHGWVFEHQKPIVRRNLERELEFQVEQHNVMEGIRSYCAVPLIVRGESIGVIIILSSQKNRYSEWHAEFLQEVSDQVVLAIKSLRPFCPKHLGTKLICPRCIASGGGQATAARYKEQLSDWGKRGGRGRKKPAGGLTKDGLG